MPNEFTLATAVALPTQSAVTHLYNEVNLADAFAIRLPPAASSNVELLARFIFSHQPSWVRQLMGVRDIVVASFGLKTGKQLQALASNPRADRVGIFKVYSTSETEIVMGEDDKHLDFRVSVLCSSGPADGRQLTISTVVNCHNLLGRVYLLVIAPFHRLVVKASLRRAARIGWPVSAKATL